LGKFDGILICTDLDGTLLNDEKKISTENEEAIAYFKKEGGLFTFVTGRMPHYVGDYYELVQPNCPIGCVNGGGIYDFEKNEYLYVEELPKEAMELLEEVDKKLPETGFQINTPDTIYFCKDSTAMQSFRKVTGIPNVVKHYYDVEETVAKVVFGEADEERMAELIKLLNEHPKAGNYDFIRSEKELYEILPKGVCKGNALKKLVEIMGLDINKTVAVGDYDNDVSMLKIAKAGVAVKNASTAAKQAADYITVSNNEHAIAKVIEDIENGKIGL